MKHQLKLLTAIVAGTLASSAVYATNGYAPHGIGLHSKGMGGVYIAYQGDAVATGGNPAGSAFMQDRVDLGVDVFRPVRDTEISGNMTPFGSMDGEYDGNNYSQFYIPEMGYRKGITSDMAFAFSLFGNGGMNTDYKDGIPLFNQTNARTGINLEQLFLVPSMSLKLGGTQSIGVGLNLVAQSFKARGLWNFTGTGTSMFDPRYSEDPTKVTNNDKNWSYGAGARIGWMGKFNNVTLGATYQTRTYMSKFDEYAGLFAEGGDFDVPSNYGAGIAVQATPNLVMSFDYVRINYSEVDSISNPMSNLFDCSYIGGTDSEACLGGDNGPGFGWDDIDIFKVGVEYKLNSAWTLRGGYNHGSAPIPESETMFNILAPATVEDHLTLSVSWFPAPDQELTVAYMHAFENTIEGENSIPAGFGGGEADITMYQDSLGVQYTWNL